MLRQKIDPLKYIRSFIVHNTEHPGSARFSLIDATLLLLVNDHPKCSKSDLTEILYGVRNHTKSTLDRPLKRLVSLDFIARTENIGAYTKGGDGRTFYSVTSTGNKFIKGCGYK